MNNIEFDISPDAQVLASKLAEDVSDKLQAAVHRDGQASLVVSGGSTPKPFFAFLATKDIAWEKITVTLADERCVEPNDDQSNAKLVADYLLRDRASKATFVSLFDGGEGTAETAANTSDVLARLPAYTVVILGMGGDGHTASIFPQATNREDALSPEQPASALLVDPVTVTPLRITQTANRLQKSDSIILHITGEEKAELLKEILDNPDSAKWPIGHFLENQPVTVYSDHDI